MDRKAYVQMRNEFYKKYKEEIVPAVAVFESERKIKLVLAMICSGTLALLGFIYIYMIATSYVSGRNSGDGIGLLFGAAFGVYYMFKKNFENKIKKRIMPTVSNCFENLTWSNGEYKDESIFTRSYLVNNYTSVNFDDIFYGKHLDVDFEIIEAEFIRGSGKNQTLLFDGAIVKLKMNKKFTGHTVIKPDTMMHASPSANLRQTTLEDVKFEKKFDVFTDDEVEARYLITPSFMERLNNMRLAFSADRISCAFYSDYLLVGLHTSKDLFSICSLFKPVDDASQYFTMYEEIVSIVRLIDYFKLDQKIGL